MSLVITGLNHNTAPLALREKLAISATEVNAAVQSVAQIPAVKEAVLVSTCNRTELYCHVEPGNADVLSTWLAQRGIGVDETLHNSLYAHHNEDMVKHLVRVASGLDSMILGEPQILGQIKQAYQAAQTAGTTGKSLSRLFQHAFAAAKRIRTETEIGANPVSVASTAVSLAKQFFADFPKRTAILLGAGQTIELTAQHLHAQGTGRMVIANRNLENASKLARQFNSYAIELDQIGSHLAEADIVISSTASPDPIITKAMMTTALRKRSHKPMFLADLAVPRDITPEIGELEDVYLYSIDDLKSVIDHNLDNRKLAAEQAEVIVAEECAGFMSWLKTNDAGNLINDLRNRTDTARSTLLKQALGMLEQGKDPRETLEFFSRRLSNKVLHDPLIILKAVADSKDPELLKRIQTHLSAQLSDPDE